MFQDCKLIMLKPLVDLTNCDTELIHIPACVQAHGFLIVVDKEMIIRFYSDNTINFIPKFSANILGQSLKHLEVLLSQKNQINFISQLIYFAQLKGSFEQINPFKIDISNKEYNLIISISAKYYLLEFERADFDEEGQKIAGQSVFKILSDNNLQSMLDNTAIQVKKIIKYDRVMLYRFADDGHGEVVAEAKNSNLEPWLGLHYPASDIPKQARELYKINLTRLIENVNTVPAKIVTAGNNLQNLDLTNAQLRAVSPVHIQYLKNMGVSSSFSISLICKNELWGLIACHNYTPRFIDFKLRSCLKTIHHNPYSR